MFFMTSDLMRILFRMKILLFRDKRLTNGDNTLMTRYV